MGQAYSRYTATITQPAAGYPKARGTHPGDGSPQMGLFRRPAIRDRIVSFIDCSRSARQPTARRAAPEGVLVAPHELRDTAPDLRLRARLDNHIASWAATRRRLRRRQVEGLHHLAQLLRDVIAPHKKVGRKARRRTMPVSRVRRMRPVSHARSISAASSMRTYSTSYPRMRSQVASRPSIASATKRGGPPDLPSGRRRSSMASL